jgi:hypothetical protein
MKKELREQLVNLSYIIAGGLFGLALTMLMKFLLERF